MKDYKDTEWYLRGLQRRKERYATDEEYRRKQNENTRRWRERTKDDPDHIRAKKQSEQDYYMVHRKEILSRKKAKYQNKKRQCTDNHTQTI